MLTLYNIKSYICPALDKAPRLKTHGEAKIIFHCLIFLSTRRICVVIVAFRPL